MPGRRCSNWWRKEQVEGLAVAAPQSASASWPVRCDGAPKRLIPSLALIALFGGSPLRAQTSRAFSTLDIAGAVSANVNREQLHELWRPGHGGLVRVSTPFYAGTVALSAQVAYFRARGDAQPDFRAITRAAEWNSSLRGGRAIRGFAGLQVGAMDMTFLRPSTHTDNPEENELLVGGQAGIALPLVRNLGLSLMVSHRRVSTHVPIHLTYASAGLEARYRTPSWLRDVLR